MLPLHKLPPGSREAREAIWAARRRRQQLSQQSERNERKQPDQEEQQDYNNRNKVGSVEPNEPFHEDPEEQEEPQQVSPVEQEENPNVFRPLWDTNVTSSWSSPPPPPPPPSRENTSPTMMGTTPRTSFRTHTTNRSILRNSTPNSWTFSVSSSPPVSSMMGLEKPTFPTNSVPLETDTNVQTMMNEVKNVVRIHPHDHVGFKVEDEGEEQQQQQDMEEYNEGDLSFQQIRTTHTVNSTKQNNLNGHESSSSSSPMEEDVEDDDDDDDLSFDTSAYENGHYRSHVQEKNDPKYPAHSNAAHYMKYHHYPQFHHTTDASCIPYHSILMIGQSYSGSTIENGKTCWKDKATLHYVAAMEKSSSTTTIHDTLTSSTIVSSQTPIIMAEMIGRGLSQPFECFMIRPVVTVQESRNQNTTSNQTKEDETYDTTRNQLQQERKQHQKQYIRCGDIVSIHSVSHSHRAFGVRKSKTLKRTMNGNENTQKNTEEDNPNEYEVGFFHKLLGPVREAETWIVLSASLPDRNVVVGENIQPHSSKNNNTVNPRNRDDMNYLLDDTFVRVGQPIILQNIGTGGILSMNSTTLHLTALTSMYQRKQMQDEEPQQHMQGKEKMQNFHSSTIGKDLLDFMNQHANIRITDRETFYMFPVNTPPVPLWASSMSIMDERVFLNGTFLKYPQRFDMRHDIEESLFRNDSTSTSLRTQYGSTSKTAPTLVNGEKMASLATLSFRIQENVLIDEVLGAMMGLEGNIIRAYPIESDNDTETSYCGIEFRLVSHSMTGGPLDASLRHIIDLLLPSCAAFVNVNAFVSSTLPKYEVGKVTHALCGAIDTLLREYLDFVLELEDRYRYGITSDNVSISEILAESQCAIQTMAILDRIVGVSKTQKGGALLNCLHNVLLMEYAGHERAGVIFSLLLDRASVPFFDMLSKWLEYGVIDDPYGEFMIKQDQLGSHDQNDFILDDIEWVKWYSIVQDHVLTLLLSSADCDPNLDRIVQKILLTGKYWNAISFCKDQAIVDIRCKTFNSIGKKGSVKKASLSYHSNRLDVLNYIQQCFDESSRTFSDIIMRDYQLLDILRFTRRYFLLDQGDFFVHFMDMAEDELLQEMPDISRIRVATWTKFSLQLGKNSSDSCSHNTHVSCKAFDEITSSLQCEFATESLVDALDSVHANSGGIHSEEPKTPSRHLYGGGQKGLTGIEAYMLGFGKRTFPLSLFLSTRTLANYQLLFRHIFFAKHVERRLVGIWLDHQMVKEYFQVLRKQMGPTFCLRHRMLHFVQNFVYYMMFEVIEPNWIHMESQILNPIKDESTEYRHSGLNKHTVDDMLTIHKDFVRTSLKECLLTNRDLVRTLTKLLTTCLLFSDQMKLFMESTEIYEEQNKTAMEARHKRDQKPLLSTNKTEAQIRKKKQLQVQENQEKRKLCHQKQIDRLNLELSTEPYKRMIRRFEQIFHSNLTDFMSLLVTHSDGDYHSHLFNLCVRLDYNGYVSRTIKKP